MSYLGRQLQVRHSSLRYNMHNEHQAVLHQEAVAAARQGVICQRCHERQRGLASKEVVVEHCVGGGREIGE